TAQVPSTTHTTAATTLCPFDTWPPSPKGGKGPPKRTRRETRLKSRGFEPDPRGDGSPQSVARGRRVGAGHVDAARPRGVAAHRPPVPVRRTCEPQRAGDRTGQRSLPAPGRRPARRLAEPDAFLGDVGAVDAPRARRPRAIAGRGQARRWRR